MAKNNPFKNRPEDFINKGMKAAISSLPVVGGTAAEFFNFVVGDPAQERRDDFLTATHNRLIDLEDQFDALRPEKLRDNEQFQATVVQAVRIASTTASAEKKKLLQNAILNSAFGTVDEFYRELFVRLLEDIQPEHVVYLHYLDNPKAYPAAVEAAKNIYMGARSNVVEKSLPQLTNDKARFARVSSDLHRMGLADTSSMNSMMTGGDGMLTRITTDVGRSFLKFVSEPGSDQPPV
ncbi:MAG: hypothetical protein QOF14_753 [Hyphomicrobiales bacterium]|jgi:hypothetical protein|nr:hypothetical protein [Hyphomicrobiales bacterium]